MKIAHFRGKTDILPSATSAELSSAFTRLSNNSNNES